MPATPKPNAHTPTPWKVSADGGEVENANGYVVADCNPRMADFANCVVSEQPEANAAFIVLAANNHAALHTLAVMCNAYLEPIADQLEICHESPDEAKMLRQLLADARKYLAAAGGKGGDK